MGRASWSAGMAIVSGLAMLTAPGAYAADACCSCQVQPATTFTDRRLPCDFDIPSGWQVVTGGDGGTVNAVAGAVCTTACPVSSGLSFSVAKKPDANAATMEQIWLQAMQVVGNARCGDAAITFFNPPGSDPTGMVGGLRFYVGYNGQKYGASATFTCPGPGEWVRLRTLFIDSFRTNQNSAFGSD
jgi:hypothetical protein